MLKAKRENDMRESAWSGRMGGMDVSTSMSKDSLYLQSKKAQRGDLPPLPIEDGTMFDDDQVYRDEHPPPVRSSSAPDPFDKFGQNRNSGNPDSPENIVKGAILKARGKAGRKKKITKSETRLMDSPFARSDHR